MEQMKLFRDFASEAIQMEDIPDPDDTDDENVADNLADNATEH